ncbi:uncharacterized protein KIAA0930 homolog isoform X1 [Asterias rubens]|uniref:uncharacterized protein KIAA0930 homolog isoform X1 n=1 Tax=Asterias rubens TaxID=7604 RepID=UPI0014558CF6|nr:uncharacterized protein KIAA0930 homolog isoform X1 [Asterias rubens]
MAANGGVGLNNRAESTFRRMISDIIMERGKVNCAETVEGTIGDLQTMTRDGFVHIPMEVNCFWTQVFAQHFLTASDEHRDDMLFFVYRHSASNRAERQTRMEVYRKDSKNLPSLGEPNIDWEESVYLNLILQQYDYILTCAVCTKTADSLSVLKKHSQQVYASPSKRRMDTKGEETAVSYPNIFFMIDNFDEVFGDVMVEEGQLICVEVVAAEKQGHYRSVIFLGSVRYESLRRVYEARASVTSRVAASMGLYGRGKSRVEFIRMKGPEGKGYAEVAVSRHHRVGSIDYSSSEDMTSGIESNAESPTEECKPIIRQPKDAAANNNHIKPALRKSRSDSETLGQLDEDRRTRDEERAMSEDEQGITEGWRNRWLRRTSSALRRFKRTQAASVRQLTLNVHLTYVTLPWHRIIGDVLETQKQPVLS